LIKIVGWKTVEVLLRYVPGTISLLIWNVREVAKAGMFGYFSINRIQLSKAE